MTKKNCYSFNEIFVVATIIIILRNIYINLDLKLLVEKNVGFLHYVEMFYALLIIFYNIILLFCKKKFKTKIEYKLKKYFILTNLIIIFFYVSKEPLFFYSSRKIVIVIVFLSIEVLFIFIHKIKIKIKNWKNIIDEIFKIGLISTFIYFFHVYRSFSRINRRRNKNNNIWTDCFRSNNNN